MNGYENCVVSAVIITYKRPVEILKRAVRSALNQTHKKMEVIVVNDYPEDSDSVACIQNMLDEFRDERLFYIVHEKNMGACKARNTGIIAAKGEYIGLLDDDDEWLPEKTEKQLEGFVDKRIGMVYSPFYNMITGLPGELKVRGTKSGNLLKDLLWKNCIGGSSMPLIRKDVFDECGLFDEELLSSQDYDMWVRIAEKFDIQCVNEPLTIRYMQGESITQNFAKQKQGFERFNQKHFHLYGQDKIALNYRYNRRVNKWIEQGHFADAWTVYTQAIKIKTLSPYNIVEPLKGVVKFLLIRRRNNE